MEWLRGRKSGSTAQAPGKVKARVVKIKVIGKEAVMLFRWDKLSEALMQQPVHSKSSA